MAPATYLEKSKQWLLEYGPAQLDALLSTVKLYPLAAIASNDKKREASEADFGSLLFDSAGTIILWSASAERIYSLGEAEVLGKHISTLYPPQAELLTRISGECQRAAGAGHSVVECWQVSARASKFRSVLTTLALRDGEQNLVGFARIVRDVRAKYQFNAEQRQTQTALPAKSDSSSVASVACGNLSGLTQMNEPFLELLGYSQEDLVSGVLSWYDLTPPEFVSSDAIAHQEALQFGASSPYEKKLIRKDGTQVAVLITTAILKAVPFQWISLVQDLSRRNNAEEVDNDLHESSGDFGEIVGISSSLRRVQRQVEVVAPTDATVLILGETGTGKELISKAIHRLSPRHKQAFITLNCAAIPTGLLESELFGYERGAFTGALSQKIGRFELAHRGTLFLDEVGDIPIDLQPKLLRALQEKSFERLGGTKTIPIDVRLVAATNRNLLQMMEDHLFRSDLYYRLKVFPITTPPLRDRPEDIPVLARYFTKKYSERMGRQIDSIPTDTLAALKAWHWPGNVRELENFIERSVILSRGPALRAPLSEIRREGKAAQGSSKLDHVEREHILKILKECNGVVTAAATRLGLHRTTLNAMMKKLGLSRRDF